MRSRETILEATRALIRTRGFGAVNVSAVAEAAGVSRQTVYSIFGTREDLVSQAVVSVAMGVLEDVRARLDTAGGTLDHVVELIVAGRAATRSEPVMQALLRAEVGNPLFDEGMMRRARPVVAGLLAPLRERDPALAAGEPFDGLVELVTRLGLTLVLFASDDLRDDEALRRFLRRWLGPGLTHRT